MCLRKSRRGPGPPHSALSHNCPLQWGAQRGRDPAPLGKATVISNTCILHGSVCLDGSCRRVAESSPGSGPCCGVSNGTLTAQHGSQKVKITAICHPCEQKMIQTPWRRRAMAPGGHNPRQVSPLTHSTTCRQDTGSSTCFPGSFSCLRLVRILQTTPFTLHVTKTHPPTWVPATLERCHSFLFGPCLTMKVSCWKKNKLVPR